MFAYYSEKREVEKVRKKKWREDESFLSPNLDILERKVLFHVSYYLSFFYYNSFCYFLLNVFFK